jgi:hypothetical protein
VNHSRDAGTGSRAPTFGASRVSVEAAHLVAEPVDLLLDLADFAFDLANLSVAGSLCKPALRLRD